MGDAIIMTLAALLGACCFLVFWISHVRQRERLYSILRAEDGGEFLRRFREVIIDKRCEKAKLFRDRCPQSEREYYSFFHHLLLPFVTTQQERTVRGGSRVIKISLVFDAIIVTMLVIVFILAGDNIASMEKYLVLIGACFLICGVPALFYLLSRSGAEDLKIYRMIDERFERFYGSPPPPYRVSLASLIEDLDRRISSRNRWFTFSDDRGERTKPKPWSKMVDEMFPQRGKNIGGDDPRFQ